MSESSTFSVAAPSKARAKVTNDPLRGRRYGRSPEARRIRDLFSALMERLGNPTDPVVVADALALAELKTAAETARTRLLDGTDRDPDQLVRLENLVRRAERRLDLKPGGSAKPTESFHDEMIRLAMPPQEAAADARAVDRADLAADSDQRIGEAAGGHGGGV